MEFKFSSVNKMLESSFKKNWDRPALSNYQGVTLSYGEVASRVAKLHIAFEQCGLRRGDKVAICSKNQANWGVSFLAALTYGAIPVPILHEFKPGNVHYLVNHSDAKVLFVDETVWEGLNPEEMPELQVVVQVNTFKFLYAAKDEYYEVRYHLNESFGKKYPDSFGPEDLNYYEDSADELAIINYTSGSSGFSKGVMIPYRAILSNILFARDYADLPLKAGSQVVSMLPSAHMYGFAFEFMFEMTIGMHVHYLSRVPSPKIIMQAMSDIKPDVIIAVPLIIEKVYKSKLKPLIDKNRVFMRIPILDKLILGKMRSELVKSFGGRFDEIILGGAAFNPEVEAFFKKMNFPYTVGYGMTECAPIIAYSHWDKAKLYSCGKPAPWMQIRIDSPDPQNISGEVQVHGPNVMLGYYKNDEITAESFTEDGWFRTGDMGVIDEDGCLFLRGRSKCMILGPSGQNIYPEELEAVVNNVTYVGDSLVIDDHGSIVALVYPDYHTASVDGISKEKLEERLAAALPEINKELPKYAQIKKMEFLPEDFERTPKKSIKRYLYQRN